MVLCSPSVATKAKQISFRGHDAQRPRANANSKAVVTAIVAVIVNIALIDDIYNVRERPSKIDAFQFTTVLRL